MIVKSLNKTILAISLGLTLVACGGGGSGSDSSASSNVSTTPTSNENTNNTTNPNTGSNNTGSTNTGSNNTGPSGDENTGSVVEKLDPTKTYRVLYSFPNSNGTTSINDVKQNDKGVITAFGNYEMSPNIVGKEITGNKNFAIARIAKGMITYTPQEGEPKATQVERFSNGSYYYFASIPLTEKIASETEKNIQCTDLQATQAKVSNGKGDLMFVAPTISNGSITLKPNGSIGVKFTSKVGADETTYVAEQNWIASHNVYNGFNILGIEGQQGQSNQIGSYFVSSNGANSLVVGSIYRITTSNDAKYEGAMSMICNI